MKKLLLFDFDGVIVDSLELYEETSRLCLEEIGGQIIKNREDFLSLLMIIFMKQCVRRASMWRHSTG